MAMFRRGPPSAAWNAGGISTNRISGRMAGYRSMTVGSTILTVIGAVMYHSYGARLFMAQRSPRVSEYAE